MGAFLRGMRESQRMSQEQLSALTGSQPWKISRPVIGAMERGEHLPSFEALMALSKVLSFDPMEVLERAENAVAVPVDITDLSLDDLHTQANDLALAGSYREALGLFDAMLERLVLDPPAEPEFSRRRADIELRRAGTLARCGALLSAEAAAKRAVSTGQGHPEIQSFAYAVLAKIQIQRDFLPLARDHARRAVELAEGCGPGAQGRAALQQGEILFVAGELEQATECFLTARKQLADGGDTRHASHVEGNVGLCWAGRGNLAKARVWLRRGLELAREQCLPILEARWLLELGKVGLGEGKPDEADRYALASLAIARPREHWLSIFRAEWLRHRVVTDRVGKEHAKKEDRSRLARLRKLMVHLADHKGEAEIREFEALTASDGAPGPDRRQG